MKHTYRNGYYQNREVAPRRGAWVETKQMPNSDKLLKVAPRRGAWVETLEEIGAIPRADKVAPRRGAWVETV